MIETVLRSNQGAVDATIDQLLQISSENQNSAAPTNVSLTNAFELQSRFLTAISLSPATILYGHCAQQLDAAESIEKSKPQLGTKREGSEVDVKSTN